MPNLLILRSPPTLHLKKQTRAFELYDARDVLQLLFEISVSRLHAAVAVGDISLDMLPPSLLAVEEQQRELFVLQILDQLNLRPLLSSHEQDSKVAKNN